MKLRARAAVIVAVGGLSLAACADDGREMRLPTFSPPTPTTSTTVPAPLSVGS